MLDVKKRSSDRERNIEELTQELDRQQIFPDATMSFSTASRKCMTVQKIVSEH